ncbi:MAG: hypothetical protein ABIS68_01385, partial [Casimicrobiaceae bacterium]
AHARKKPSHDSEKLFQFCQIWQFLGKLNLPLEALDGTAPCCLIATYVTIGNFLRATAFPHQ